MQNTNRTSRTWRRWGWAGTALAVVVAVVVFVWNTPSATSAPHVTFNTVDSGALSSESLRGHVVLVNFWSTTCSVCMQEMPHLVQVYRDLHERGFEVVAVAMPSDRPDLVLDYRQRKELPFKVAIDYDGKVNRAFGGIEVTPTSFLVDAQGKIVERIVGAPDFEKLRAAISAELPRHSTQ